MNEQNITFFANGANFMYLLCVGIAVLKSGKLTRMRTILGVISIYFAIWTFKDIFFCFASDGPERFNEFIFLLDGWSAVAYAAYLIELSSPKWVTVKKTIIVLIPFFAFMVAYFLSPSWLLFHIYTIFLILFSLVIVTVSMTRSLRYLKYIRNTYSNIDDIDISWLKYIYLWFASMQIMWVIDARWPSYTMDTVYYIFFSVGWYRVIHYSKNLQTIDIDNLSHEEDTEKIEDGSEGNSHRYLFAGRLENLIIGQELYKKVDLTLYDLTRVVNTNRTYISEYFKNVLNTTFYDYINQLRIEKAAVPLLDENDSLTIEAIANMSGFNSVSTFRRAFVKYMDMTPSQYRAEHCGLFVCDTDYQEEA